MDPAAPRPEDPRAILARVVGLHDEVDAEVAPLVAMHRDRLRCGRGCTDCCTDDLTVLEVEALRIRAAHGALLDHAEPAPEGRCAMLDADGACRIYDARPYVCRTQGLPLRWIDEQAPGEWVELRDICPLNDPGPPIEALDLHECWSLGIHEPRLADLQDELQQDDGPLRRVALRDLFRRPGSGPP